MQVWEIHDPDDARESRPNSAHNEEALSLKSSAALPLPLDIEVIKDDASADRRALAAARFEGMVLRMRPTKEGFPIRLGSADARRDPCCQDADLGTTRKTSPPVALFDDSVVDVVYSRFRGRRPAMRRATISLTASSQLPQTPLRRAYHRRGDVLQPFRGAH